MAGRHAEKRSTRKTTAVIAVAIVLAALGAGSAVALSLRSGDHPSKASANAPAASAADLEASRAAEAARAARDARPSELPVPSAAATSASPTATPKPSAPASRKATPTKTGNVPTTVSSRGTCGVSFYDTGSTTANGERFDPDGLTAANKTLPFNTMVRVTNRANGKSVVVRINDRGPFVSGRCIDLARGAFKQIASLSAGVLNADFEVLA